MWWFLHTLFLWIDFSPLKKKSLHSPIIHREELHFSLCSDTLLHPAICNDFKVGPHDAYRCFPSSRYKSKSITKVLGQTLPGLCTRVHPSPSPLSCISEKKVRFHWRRREGSYFKHFLVYLFFFFLQRTPESLNDRLFKAGKIFKNNPFQPCHLALVVIRDKHPSICSGKRSLGLESETWVRVLLLLVLWL